MPLTQDTIAKLNYGSIQLAGDNFRSLQDADPAEAVSLAATLSETRAYRLTRGILQTVPDRETYVAEAGGLVHWAAGGNSSDRQLVARALRNDGGKAGSVFLVHQISGMTRQQARPFMQDYLASGGDMAAVAEWMAAAGRVLRKHRVKSPGTADMVVDGLKDAADWVVDKLEDAVDAIAEAVTGVVDAIVSAGRSLVEFVGEVISWTAEAVGDLVEALLEAGESLFDILAAAVDYGVAAVTKFVRAMVDIGKTIGEVLVEGLKFVGGVLTDVVDGLLKAGKALVDIVVWAAGQVADITRRTVQALIELGRSVTQILRTVINAAADIVRATVEAMLAIGRTVGELLITAITEPGNFFRAVVEALDEIGTTLNQFFDSMANTVTNAARRVARILTEIGHSLLDLAEWAVQRGGEILKDVLRGIVEAGKTALDIFTSIATKAVAFVADVIQAMTDIGRTLVDLVHDIVSLGLEFTRRFVAAMKRLADGLVRFAAEVARLTYRAAEALVGAMIDAGLAVAEILATAVEGTYWMFRRMVNGIISRTGRFGEILDWVLTQAEDTVSELWEDALQAARFAGQNIKDAVAWAVARGDEALDAVLNGWETMGENLVDFYEEAARLAQSGVDFVFERIGQATIHLENSVSYVLKYLEKDFLPGMRDFIKGALDAGYEIAELVVDLGTLTAQAAIRGFRVLLDLGHTLTELLIAGMENPDELLPSLLTAAEEAGNSLRDIYQVVIVDTGGEYEAAVTQTLRDLEKPIKDMLNAALEVGFGAVDTVLATLLSGLASYREMTPQEIATARLVYGDTFDYSRIRFSQESLSNDIIFGVQGWFEENDRAFVTNTLVNFDVNDGGIDNATMIHELCHVWQFQETGPFYMAEAIHAQVWGAGYNYDADGNGGEDDLQQVFLDHPGLSNEEVFEVFNREQQADIIKHYYERRFESSPSQDVSAWEPFQQVVHS
ncbi:hypothetical protein [Lewinella sp. IMCC34191]|uniref:hypothetical protein n=1 Tax=Lewinella sp. IMCC34191 TaxID=2259172 RepID=UPI000E25A4A8|nr:hypothetical protein [Lewinella sp. IMCC34191]